MDPLSVTASIAGLIGLADIVIRNGYKYVKKVKEADKAVASLVTEVNLLSGTLHSLRNIAEGLESDTAPIIATTKMQHIDSCQQTLRKVQRILDKIETSKSKGKLYAAGKKALWPMAQAEIKEITAEVEKQRTTLSLALNADEM